MFPRSLAWMETRWPSSFGYYHDDDLPGPEAAVEITMDGLPREISGLKLQHFRIDEDHSNAFTAWKRMGSPTEPKRCSIRGVGKSRKLASLVPPGTVKIENRSFRLNFSLPRQGVSLLVLD